MVSALRGRPLVVGTAMVGGLLMSGLAHAQGSVAAQEVTIPGGVLVLVAYMALWLAFGGYLMFILLKQKQVQRDLQALERRIDEVFSSPES